MRHALAVIFLLFAGTAHADSAEDFDMCPLPADPNDEIDVDAIGTTIALMVERMAAE
jgi:hypothetical protein